MDSAKPAVVKEQNHLGEKLFAILKICQKISSERDLTALLDLIAVEATKLVEADRATIFLLDREKHELWSKVALGSEEILRFDAGAGIAGAVVKTGKLINVEDAHRDTRFYPGIDARTGYHTRSLLAVPIRLRDRTLGALYLTEKPGGFTADDEAILTAMAADAAVAIENASLVKRLRDALHDLEEAQQRLVQAEALRAAGEMAAGVAHHLNNALTVIQGRAELALSTVDDPRVRSTLEVMQRAAGNAARIVRRMQELTSAPSARADPLGDLSELARQAVALIQAQWKDRAGERDISIEVSTEAGQSPAVGGDPVSLTGMIENLLLNAAEAMPDGGRIAVRTWASGLAVHCSVGDTGAGMSEDIRRRALEPFFTTKGPKRSGLGLSISHGIAQRHRGNLGIESAVGRGTTVTISLPAASAPAGTEERPGEGAG